MVRLLVVSQDIEIHVYDVFVHNDTGYIYMYMYIVSNVRAVALLTATAH